MFNSCLPEEYALIIKSVDNREKPLETKTNDIWTCGFSFNMQSAWEETLPTFKQEKSE